MQTAEEVIRSIDLLPEEEKEKLTRYIIQYGIMGTHENSPEILNLKQWQDDIARKPFTQLSDLRSKVSITSITI